MNRFDRNLRLLAGAFFTAWLIAGGPPWTIVGLYFVLTGAWRFCPLYALMARKKR